MSVYKQFNGKRITSKHPRYKDARWWVYKRIKGHKTLHQTIPEASTREQAEAAERKLIDAVFNQRFGITDNTTTFEHFVENTYRKYVNQKNVNKAAKDLYIRFLNSELGSRVLTSITPQDCRDVQYNLQKRGDLWKLHKKPNPKKQGQRQSASSVNQIMSTLSMIFTIACQEGKRDSNPMDYVVPLEEPQRRKKLLTKEQKESLFNIVSNDDLLLDLVLIAINNPVRKGQILSLSKPLIDFERDVAYIGRSKNRPPREIPFNPTTRAILLRRCAATDNLLFPMKDFKRRWRTATLRAGINVKGGKRGENFTFHDLRNEFASELIRKKNSPKTVQKLFAHSDMKITDVYILDDIDLMREAVNSIDATNLQPNENDGRFVN